MSAGFCNFDKQFIFSKIILINNGKDQYRDRKDQQIRV